MLLLSDTLILPISSWLSMQSEHFPLNTPFKPSSALVPWFIIDFLIFVVFVSEFVVVPLFLSESPETLIWVLGGLAALVILFHHLDEALL